MRTACGSRGGEQHVILSGKGDAGARDFFSVRFECGLGGELCERTVRGAPLCLRHTDEIALFVGGVSYTDATRPNAHARGRDLALAGRQQLRVAHAGQVLVAGHDRGDRHRTGPRPAPDFVDSDHDAVSRSPAFPLDPKRRIRRDHSG